LLIYFEVLSVIIELELVISNGIYHASNLSCLLSFLILSLFFSLDWYTIFYHHLCRFRVLHFLIWC